MKSIWGKQKRKHRNNGRRKGKQKMNKKWYLHQKSKQKIFIASIVIEEWLDGNLATETIETFFRSIQQDTKVKRWKNEGSPTLLGQIKPKKNLKNRRLKEEKKKSQERCPSGEKISLSRLYHVFPSSVSFLCPSFLHLLSLFPIFQASIFFYLYYLSFSLFLTFSYPIFLLFSLSLIESRRSCDSGFLTNGRKFYRDSYPHPFWLGRFWFLRNTFPKPLFWFLWERGGLISQTRI